MIRAVLFDLDDTLYPQASWLDGAWAAVASTAAARGVDGETLHAELRRVAADGSDGGRIIDRALDAVGASDLEVEPLLRAFRAHAPTQLVPYPGAVDALVALGEQCALGVVSDGDPGIQQAKLDALGLAPHFEVVVWSDEHGREHRKPDPLPFRLALDALGTDPADAVFVGDRPEKDVAGPVGLGMRAVRVRTGEWSSRPDDDRAWASVATVADAAALLLEELDGDARAQGASAPTSSRNSNNPGTRR